MAILATKINKNLQQTPAFVNSWKLIEMGENSRVVNSGDVNSRVVNPRDVNSNNFPLSQMMSKNTFQIHRKFVQII